MPFSHHSHSGQFCPGHAKNTLEEMVQVAIAKGMRVYALTEHMQRDECDFYPDERNIYANFEQFVLMMDDFHEEACRLREKYASEITLLIGFECEWIRRESIVWIKELQEDHEWDLFVGSVHHVHTHPIDYDRKSYELARDAAGGADERLFEDYFDAQYDMLQKVRPLVVGHFDLIRLLSDDCNQSFKQYDGVWSRIERNLKFISEYGGILELNSAALRKGMSEPYPKVEICQTFLNVGGRFCLSDDAHSIEQVGQNYKFVLEAAKAAGIRSIHYYMPTSRGEKLKVESVALSNIAIDESGKFSISEDEGS